VYPGKAPRPRELGEVLKKHRVHTLWLTAALFNTVIDQEPQAFSEVKQLLIGGEALSVPHVRKGLALLPATRMINGYGPTEGTTFTCCYRIARQLDENRSSIPIGKPIGNTKVYILDAHLNPVPIGVVGELYIGGDGLARGYLNRPELTKEKFIANPFGTHSTSRLYKTGDLGRYLPDGNIEFLGRIDNQVKLRGYRIELGEIEVVLSQHPKVQSSVVVVREDTPDDKRLVAYVVGQQGESFDASELRNYLKQKLPEYMIPSDFVLLDQLPLTPNGKVDRKVLPAPDQDRPELGNVYQAPRTLIEETLASIWSELLKVDKVGIHDNFFELGGHSLLATQIMSRVRSGLSVEVPLRTLFESPTIEQMAAAIMEHREKQSGEQESEYVLFELESRPDEEAQRLLAEETGSTSAGEPHE
jgi:acyl-CoA synthetase (AMP-forming)/AMP-acid ligase II/acyl carrier protein